MQKRWISLLLMFALILGVAPVPAQATTIPSNTSEIIASGYCGTEGVNRDNVTWTLYGDGTLELTGHGRMMDYSITNWIQAPWYGYRSQIKAVVAEGIENIGSIAFYGGDFKIESVKLGDSVQSVGWMAFTFTGTLKTVEFGTGIQRIEGDAFGNCGNLTTVTFPGSSLSYLSENAFNSCGNLNAVHITDLDTWCKVEYETLQSNPLYYAKNLYLNGELVTEVAYPAGSQYVYGAAFANCKSLEKVTIPDGVQAIGPYAFFGCEKLNEISIADSVSVLDYEAFKNCTSLSSIDLPNSLETIGGNAFYGCTALREITIPDNVTQIENGAFRECSALTTAVLPDSLVSLGENAFYNCKSLADISIPDGTASIGNYAFYNCDSFRSVSIPNSVTSIGNAAFEFCTGLTSVLLGNGITTISEELFYGCSSLTNVIIPDSVISIGTSAFSGCSGLTGINIPGSLAVIGESAFRNCSSLETINIPNSVTTIGKYAFRDCSNLTSINIPSSVTSISAVTFYGCSSLTGINIPSSVTSIGEYAFYGCSSLTSINIPSSVTSIDDYVFSGCSSLTSVSIPSSVTSIGYHAFSSCSSLTDINIPSSVTSISSGAFSGCSSLTSIDIPSGVTSIGATAFSGCRNMTSISIPSSVTSIGRHAFRECSSLTSINIPSSVTSIERGTFFCCSSLTSINIPSSVTSIESNTFYYCISLTDINIPKGVTSIGDCAFERCNSLNYVTFSGDAPAFGNSVFYNVTATAYYPANNPTWTADVMQHYGGNITWLPYDPAAGYPASRKHSTLAELTEEDYWVLSKIAYWDFDEYLDTANPKTLKEALIGMKKWDSFFEDTDMKYSELCGAIGHWKVVDVGNYSNSNGFYGVTFANGDDAVIAYRGSIPLNSLDAILSMDAFYDWVLNDLYPILLNRVFSQGQYNNAITMYENAEKVSSNIAVTGHSLGGGLADIISARYGCKGVSMNAISILDAFYVEEASALGSSFAGVDKWEFIDHANQHDVLAGSFEMLLAPLGVSKVKPVIVHQNISPYEPSTVLNAVNYHGLGSFIERNAHGTPSLTDRVSAFIPDDTVTSFMGNLLTSVDLGTSNNNNINHGLSVAVARVSYGGDGQDTISTNIWGDTLIGGRGYDELDGSWGNDIYYYYKGDGVDTIHDVDGSDRLFLLGFDEDDTFSVLEDYGDDYIHIRSGGETIVKISKKNREYVLNAQDRFKIIVGSEDSDKETEVYDITDAFYKYTYGEHLYIGCPVHVEVLCPKGNVVFTLTDGEVGTWYTDYGNFYVFEEENGEYGKVLDLVEGYTARIVGADEGTMDVTYQIPVNGELSEPVSVSGVPVTEDLTATIKETEDGDVYLVVDEDNDGETDSERKLYGECPFTDVPEGSFYYEPVMWAVEEGITNGATETTYNPNGTCLRAQVVTFLHRADGNPEPTSTRNPFTDVKSSDFFYKPVLWAVEKGVTNGVSATAFGSYANCNRAAVVTFLWRAAGSPEPESTSNPFVDVKTTDFFYKPVLWAVENGITNGVDATHFGPATDCNRAQVVTFLYRAYN